MLAVSRGKHRDVPARRTARPRRRRRRRDARRTPHRLEHRDARLAPCSSPSASPPRSGSSSGSIRRGRPRRSIPFRHCASSSASTIPTQVIPMNAYMSASRWSRALLVAAVVVTPAVAGAQAPAPGAKIGLQDAIALALRQSVDVKQSENAVASSSTTVESKQGAFLPSLSLNSSTARSVGRAGSSSLAGGSSTAQSLNTGISSSARRLRRTAQRERAAPGEARRHRQHE